jgi:hypothetical protein
MIQVTQKTLVFTTTSGMREYDLGGEKSYKNVKLAKYWQV